MTAIRSGFTTVLLLFVGLASLGAAFPAPLADTGPPMPVSIKERPKLAPTRPAPPTPQDISVKTPQDVKLGDTVILAVENLVDAEILWISFDAEIDYKQTEKDRDIIDINSDEIEFRSIGAGSLVFKAKKPGKFVFVAIVIPFDRNANPTKQYRHVIEVKGQKDDDDDKDDPVEPIAEFTKDDYLVLIEESGDRPPNIAKIVTSKFWLQELREKGYKPPMVVDKDDRLAKQFLQMSERQSSYRDIPFMAIMREDGDKNRFIRSFPVPSDLDALKKELGLE